MNPEKLTAAIMLVALTFGAGLQVNREHLVAAFKNVSLLVWALIANFIVIPALGVLIAKLFRLPPFVATGYLLMAIAPGVPFVLASVRKRGGSLGFAIALELLLPLISIVTIPLTAALVLPATAAGEIPVGQFVKTLVIFQLLPLLVGIVVGYRATGLAEKLARPLQLVFFLAAIALIVIVFPKLVESVRQVYGSNGMLAMLCLVLLSIAVGWAFGGPARENRRVLAIGSALRNIGLCALIATTNFREVQVISTVMCYFIIQFVVVTLVGIYFARTAERAPA
jgi:bile acid:Na+ symporter, BASS family